MTSKLPPVFGASGYFRKFKEPLCLCDLYEHFIVRTGDVRKKFSVGQVFCDIAKKHYVKISSVSLVNAADGDVTQIGYVLANNLDIIASKILKKKVTNRRKTDERRNDY